MNSFFENTKAKLDKFNEYINDSIKQSKKSMIDKLSTNNGIIEDTLEKMSHYNQNK